MKKNAVIVLSLCGLFLFYKYIAQLFPSLIGHELLQSSGYDGVMVAIIASSYYYSYLIMQMGAGLIIDRYSIKIPMVLAIFSISIMIFVFTHINNFYLLCLSRVIMGIGASFATVIYMKCAAYYTTPKTFGIISSLLATVAMLGAACGGAPIAFLFEKFGWKMGLNLVAVVGVFMSAAVLVFLKSKIIIENSMTRPFGLNSIKEVIAKKDNWLLLVYSGLTFSPVAILGGLWGTPFLIIKYAIPPTKASFLLSIMFIGHAVGSPLWALLSAQLNCKKAIMYFANVISFMAIIVIIYGNISYFSTLIWFFVFGFSVGCFMLSFEICREMNALYFMGLAVAFINSGEGLVGSIVEPFIGYMLDISKIGSEFTLANYQTALFILPCCFILSTCALFFINRARLQMDMKSYVGI